MVKGYHVINDKLYHFGSDGALIEIISKQNGWLKVDNEWYYFKDGRPIIDSICLIDGKLYAFYNGRMETNTIIYNDGNYYVNKNGVVETSEGWKQIDSEWVYVGSDGRLLTGIHKINGKEYCFDWGGYWIQ